ncbi:MAG TPA: hypothetical protein H9669_07235 [Firmicutes bacterium]|nr:hypothetical protein [Bacillota bacterium]
MDTEKMIRELEIVEDKHKHDKVFTGHLNISEMAHDVRKRLEELKHYEDTGLTPDQIRELKERDTEYFCKTSIFDPESVVCKCGNDIEKDSGFDFCPYCGNRIKLED